MTVKVRIALVSAAVALGALQLWLDGALLGFWT